MTLKLYLRSSSFITVSKPLAHALGGPAGAAILQEMLNLLDLHEQKGDLMEGGWFPLSIAQLQRATAVKRAAQARVLDELQALKILELEKFGKSNKRHVRFTEKAEERIIKLVNNYTDATSNAKKPRKPKPASAAGQTASQPKAPTLTYSLYEVWAKVRKEQFPNLPIPDMKNLAAKDQVGLKRIGQTLGPYVQSLKMSSEEPSDEERTSLFEEILRGMTEFQRKTYSTPAKIFSNLDSIIATIAANTPKNGTKRNQEASSQTERAKADRAAANAALKSGLF